MDYDTGFVIAPDTVRFRQRRVEKPMLCHELFYCAEVHATPFLTRTQVQGVYPLADFVAEWEGAGVAFFQLSDGEENPAVTRLMHACGSEETAFGTFYVCASDGSGLDEGHVQAVTHWPEEYPA